jgi:hypothetical protein
LDSPPCPGVCGGFPGFAQPAIGARHDAGAYTGSHDPLKGIPLDANPTNGSKDGSNAYAVPYHTTLTDSEGMIIEIDGQAGVQVVNQICTWTKVNNGWDPCYTGISGTNFSLTPGQAYLVQVTANHSYTPSHY